MKQGRFLNLNNKEKIIAIFPGDIEGYKEANNLALLKAIINTEHGYYIRKDNKGYKIIEIKEPKKPNL